MSLGFNNSPLVRFREAGTLVVPASWTSDSVIRPDRGDHDA